MGRPVVTVVKGGIPVIDVTADATMSTKYGMAVSEAANGIGLAVTKVNPNKHTGIAVIYVVPPL